MRRWIRPAGIVCVVLTAGACGDTDIAPRLERLEARVDALAQRLDTPAAAVEDGTGVAGDIRSLERRLAEVERRVTAAVVTATEPDGKASLSGGDATAARLQQRRERRAQLRVLTDEYRARLAAIRQEHTDPAARQQAVREALEWYRTERRAVLMGEESP